MSDSDLEAYLPLADEVEDAELVDKYYVFAIYNPDPTLRLKMRF